MAGKEKVIVVGSNLFLLPRIQNVTDALGVDCKFVTTLDQFSKEYEAARPVLVLIDFEADSSAWAAILMDLRDARKDAVKVVAFGPHADIAGMDAARKLGADHVLAKGQFSTALPKIIESRGASVR